MHERCATVFDLPFFSSFLTPLQSNVVAGISLYAGRPFIVGDHVKLLSQTGSVVASGVVQAIAISRTILRADDGAQIIINNADIAKMIVRNESSAGAMMP